MQSLQSASLLKQWHNSCQQYQQLNARIRQCIPEHLQKFFLHALQREKQHIVLVLNDSSAYLVFHQHLQLVQKKLQSYYTLASLSLRVAPGGVSAPVEKKPLPTDDPSITMSAQALESFQSLQHRVRHDKLRSSIEKLLKNRIPS